MRIIAQRDEKEVAFGAYGFANLTAAAILRKSRITRHAVRGRINPSCATEAINLP